MNLFKNCSKEILYKGNNKVDTLITVYLLYLQFIFIILIEEFCQAQ